MNSREARVVGLGFCACDHIYTVADYPDQGGKTRILDRHVQGGGQVATAMVALAKLGVPVRFIGTRGDDEAGDLIESEMRGAGVDRSGLITVPDCSSQQAFIIVPRSGIVPRGDNAPASSEGSAVGGERTIFWRRDPRLDLSAADLDPRWIPRSPHLLLIDGHEIDACCEAIRLSQERGGVVVLDAEYCESRTAALIAMVDHLVADEHFPRRFLGADCPGPPDTAETLAALHRPGMNRVVVTLGARGAVSWDGENLISVPAFDLPVVDTTGAGDAFHAGYCYGLLAGMTEKDRLRFACAVAGLKCRAPGGRAGLPSLPEVARLLAGEGPAG
jgi:sugar/nucleoside kinase (ribokinase family)